MRAGQLIYALKPPPPQLSYIKSNIWVICLVGWGVQKSTPSAIKPGHSAPPPPKAEFWFRIWAGGAGVDY